MTQLSYFYGHGHFLKREGGRMSTTKKRKKRKTTAGGRRGLLIVFIFLCFMLIPTLSSFLVIFLAHRQDIIKSTEEEQYILVTIPGKQQKRSLVVASHHPQKLVSAAATADYDHHAEEEGEEETKQEKNLAIHDENKNTSGGTTETAISVVILTFDKQDALAKLLPTVISQKGITFEIIIVDNGCKPKTQQVVEDAFKVGRDITTQRQNDTSVQQLSSIKYEYIQMCHNPGYAIGNNEGVKKSSNETKWVLFLNDDIVLKDEHFISNMIRLGESRKEAAAVGCVMTTSKGDELIEAGSIVWNDGSAASFGRGRKDLSAPEFSYPRPVDYVSGACLMVDKSVFLDYGGFDHEHFVNYYEDTDLQMHIQHDLGKEVWVQPLSVAHHEEHGSFGKEESVNLMKKSHKIFIDKWRGSLQKYHLPPPFHLPQKEQDTIFLRGSDIRERKHDKASILYIDGSIPNKRMGSGFGRAFDNLSILASLGHKVTVVSLEAVRDDWCNGTCLDHIRQLGIEVFTCGWSKFYVAKDRPEFYNVVIVSRPGTFLLTHKRLQSLYKKSPFAIIYDSEALTYRRDEMLTLLVEEDGIMFPGISFLQDRSKGTTFSKRQELTMLSMTDHVVTVSVQETELVQQLVSNSDVETIGHIMDLNAITKNQFSQRNGILYVGSFHDIMYYNGDAIWYFLDKIYPLVLQDQQATEPIQLTIAGRDIPLELIRFVTRNATLARHVTFLESPESIDDLMEDNRLFIAPHQYGSGIQYKVSEAFAFGVPVVMSGLTAESFGLKDQDNIGCIGSNIDSFKECILRLYNNERDWNEARENAMEFIRTTHNRDSVLEKWTNVMDKALVTAHSRRAEFESSSLAGGKEDIHLMHNLFKLKVPKF